MTLIAEGIDGASRGGSELGEDANVEAILGPAVTDALWSLVALVVEDASWSRITVDAFASESSAGAPCFWSRFHEPGSEDIDALCVLD